MRSPSLKNWGTEGTSALSALARYCFHLLKQSVKVSGRTVKPFLVSLTPKRCMALAVNVATDK